MQDPPAIFLLPDSQSGMAALQGVLSAPFWPYFLLPPLLPAPIHPGPLALLEPAFPLPGAPSCLINEAFHDYLSHILSAG